MVLLQHGLALMRMMNHCIPIDLKGLNTTFPRDSSELAYCSVLAARSRFLLISDTKHMSHYQILQIN